MLSFLTSQRGILLMIAGSSIFAANDAFSKLALQHIPTSQVIAVRGLMAALLLGGLVVWKGLLPMVRYGLDRYVLLRAMAEAGVAILFITSIITLSIADATAILQVAPLVTMAIAVLLFGARIGWPQWVAVIVAFAGVTMIVKPGSSAFDVMALLPLGAAFLIAMRDFATVRIGARVPTLVVTFFTALVGMLAGFAGSAIETWQAIETTTLLYLVGGSISLVTGHLLTIAAFRSGDAATIAPFRYAAVVCSVALSAIIFHDMPDIVSIAGMAVIMAAGLYSMRHHMAAQKALKAALAKAQPEPREAAP